MAEMIKCISPVDGRVCAARPVATRKEIAATFAAAPALTTTVSRSAPAAAMVPSVVAITAVSALKSVMLAVATPFVNVTDVAAPKFVAPILGLVLFGDTFAPLNVTLFAPV